MAKTQENSFQDYLHSSQVGHIPLWVKMSVKTAGVHGHYWKFGLYIYICKNQSFHNQSGLAAAYCYISALCFFLIKGVSKKDELH